MHSKYLINSPRMNTNEHEWERLAAFGMDSERLVPIGGQIFSSYSAFFSYPILPNKHRSDKLHSRIPPDFVRRGVTSRPAGTCDRKIFCTRRSARPATRRLQ